MKHATQHCLPILLLTVMLISGCSRGVDQEERYRSAEASFQASRYSEAIIDLKNILQSDTKHQQARILLARSYLAIGDGLSAEKELSRVNESTRKQPEVQEVELAAWELQGKFQPIVDAYENQGISDPGGSRVREIVSNAYIHLKKPQLADELASALLSEQPRNVNALIMRANAASMRDEDDTAIEYLNRAIGIDSENREVWRVLGGIQIKHLQYEQAVDSLKKAVALAQPGDSRMERFLTQVTLIQLLVQQGRMPESQAYLDELTLAYPGNPLVLYLKGLLHYIGKQYDASKTDLTQALSKMPNHLPTLLLLGAIHFSQNNLEQANLLLTRYVNQVPTHLQARKLLGEIKLRLNKPKEALSLLKSTQDKQDDADILSMIGIAASQSGDYLQGVEYLKKAMQSHPEDTRIREELAKLYLSQGAVEDAIGELEKLDSADNTHTNALLLMSYLKKQDYAAARKLSDQMLSGPESTHSPVDYYLRALIEMATGKRNESRHFFLKATQKDPAYTPAQIALGRLDLEDGRLRESGDRLNLVLAKDPQNLHVLMLLAQISERMGHQKEALEWLEKAAASASNPVMPRIILARYYLRTRQPDKATRYLDDPDWRNSNDPAILSLIAELNQQLGRTQEAESLLQRVIELNPQQEGIHLQLANLQLSRGDTQAARDTIKTLATPSSSAKRLLFRVELKDKRYPHAEAIAREFMQDAKTRFNGIAMQAQVYQQQGKYRDATILLKKQLSGAAPFYLVQMLADNYVKLGETYSAINLLKQQIEQSSGGRENQAKLALAMLYQSDNQANQAVSLYQSILEKDGNNIVALNNAALLSFESDPERALEYAQRAYRKVGDSSLAVADTYAWLKHLSGDTRTALQVLEPVARRTEDPAIQYHYAAILNAMGKNHEALAILKQVFENNQQFHESEEAKRLLSALSSANG
ncbi:MAG: XrtA/PEP-CTERM system TPR-repeat protein PrsT [Candidatus Thiodiazotropha sp.]